MSQMWTDRSETAVARSGADGEGCGWEDHVFVPRVGLWRVWWGIRGGAHGVAIATAVGRRVSWLLGLCAVQCEGSSCSFVGTW